MQDERIKMFKNRLVKVSRHLSRKAKKLGVSCYRLYDHDLPEFPVCIEVYGDKIYIAEYRRRHGMTENEHNAWLENCIKVIKEVLSVEKESIFLKLRQRKPGRLGQYKKLPARPDGNAGKNEFVVQENELKFLVNLGDYLDTGLFLDHRITRQLVREQSEGKKVLNLFAYTGSFSVYAAAGKATEIVTLDLSKTYLNWAERNMHLNGFSDKKVYQYLHSDVKQYLQTIPSEYFDLVVMDPPTFSNSKRMEDFLDIQKDHVQLINQCLQGIKKGGVLYFSTNYRKFLLEEKEIKAALVNDITKATTPFDFEDRLFRMCFRIIK